VCPRRLIAHDAMTDRWNCQPQRHRRAKERAFDRDRKERTLRRLAEAIGREEGIQAGFSGKAKGQL